MLPPVSSVLSTSTSYQRPMSQTMPSTEVAVAAAPATLPDVGLESSAAARFGNLKLSGSETLADTLVALAETLGKAINLPRREGEAGMDYLLRLSETIKTLDPADQAKVDAYLAEMQKIVSSAAGINAARGDVVTLTAMDFLENQLLADADSTGPGIMDMLNRNVGGIINSLAFVVVAFLVVWLGIRPLVRSVGGNAITADSAQEGMGLELPDFSPEIGGGAGAALMDGFGSDFGFDSADDLLGDSADGGFNRRVREGPERRLARMV